MDPAERLSAAVRRLADDLAHALGNVPPDIAESALGRTMIAGALIAEAVALLAADADWLEARALAAALVAAAGRPGPDGEGGGRPK